MLNEREPPPIAATLLLTVLEAAGTAAQGRYRCQFIKVVTYVEQHTVPLLLKLAQKSSRDEAECLMMTCSQLQQWLEKFRTSGQAPAAKGRDVDVTQELEVR